MNTPGLDTAQLGATLDKSGMLGFIRGLPQQCRQAWQQGLGLELPQSYSTIKRIVVLGMGGSAIGADLAAAVLSCEEGVPLTVHRGYGLPFPLDAETLVVASSYSGNTEETLSGFEQALSSPARVLAFTTGGRLRQMAQERRIPLFLFAGQGPPRASLGFSFLGLLGVLNKLGLTRDKTGQVEEMLEVLERLCQRWHEDVPQAQNLAKQLAVSFQGNLPVVYGCDFLIPVARRWKTQLNENSKAWAFYRPFPELNHNDVVGYHFPADLGSRLCVLMLRSPLLNRRNLLRYDITTELLERAGVPQQTVNGEGQGVLSQMMGLVLLGDYVSYYLSLLYGVDPTPVPTIDYLKQRLAGE